MSSRLLESAYNEEIVLPSVRYENSQYIIASGEILPVEAEITFRHNMMSIQSIDTFINIRGGYHNGLRDVYFVRALGEPPNMISVVKNLDDRMNREMTSGHLLYKRLHELPKLIKSEDISYYSDLFAAWNNGRDISLKNDNKNKIFRKVLSEATKRVIAQYRNVKINVSETMLKNYVVKLWFWADNELTEITSHWSERLCAKIVADNVTNEQEYLFYYMATLLGCDVMILNTRGDTEIPESVKALSCTMRLGAYGNTVLPGYVRPMPQTGEMSPEKKCNDDNGTQPAHNNQKTSDRSDMIRQSNTKSLLPVPNVPERSKTDKAPSDKQSNSVGTRTVVSSRNTSRSAINQRPKTSSARKEKSFEQLALLASSIVMIVVIDRHKKPVATGSGIMIGKNGYILTNYHVVKEGIVYAVRIEDDEQTYFSDEIIKYHPKLDMAVIRISRKLAELPVYNGKTKLVRGQKVVAIGSPLGLFNSVSDGIISGFRTINDINMIQFTAPISHGSSGGAVLNMYGEVIGLSTAGIDSGQNINLAVGYEDIRMFANGFIG